VSDTPPKVEVPLVEQHVCVGIGGNLSAGALPVMHNQSPGTASIEAPCDLGRLNPGLRPSRVRKGRRPSGMKESHLSLLRGVRELALFLGTCEGVERLVNPFVYEAET